MSYNLSHLKNRSIVYESDEFGGGTHFVDGTPICLHPISGNVAELCEKGSGHGTIHKGFGRCLYHEDNKFKGGVTRFVNGRYSKFARDRLARHVQHHLDDPDMLNLSEELAILRSMLSMFIEENPRVKMNQISTVNNMIQSIAHLVDRIHRMNSREILTYAAVRLIISKATDVAQKYIPDQESQIRFIEEWQNEVQLPSITDSRQFEERYSSFDE